MGIVTNRISMSTKEMVDHLQIKEYFDVFATPDRVPTAKPHPDHINTALEMMGLHGEKWGENREARVLYVGDAEVDV